MLSKFLRASVNNTTNPTNSDPNFNQVSLLLHGDGTNGAQNNTFLDSSTNNFTVTRNGTPTQGTNTPFSQADGYWSNYFNGTSAYLTTPADTAFNFGTGDFTIECWFYLTNNAAVDGNGNRTASIFAISNSINTVNFHLAVRGNASTTGTGFQLFKNQNTTVSFSTVTTIIQNTWNHVAAVKLSGVLYFYFNGVQIGSLADSTSWGSSTLGARIGSLSNSNTWFDYFPGYISNTRIVKGTAVYTSNFTPPTTPLTAVSGTSLLTCQSNYFKDNSSNNFTITATGTPSVQPWSPFAPTSAYSTSVNGGSMYFNGDGSDTSNTSSLSTAYNSAYAFGTSDFTIECFIYCTIAPSGNAKRILSRSTTGTTNPYAIWIDSSRQIAFNFVIGGTQLTITSSAITLNTWTHIAAVRNGNVFSLYINGVSSGTPITNSGAIDSSTEPLYIGNRVDNIRAFPGYISNVRMVNGTAVYTTTFTPPTAPLTAITNTSLLLSGTNAGIYDNAIKNDLVTVGNAQVSTAVTKFGTGSMYFDGTGDWLTSPDTPNLQLGTGNFTIEGWVYLNAIGTARGFVSKGTSTTGWSLGVNALNQVVFNYASSTINSTGLLAVSTWYFVTVVREGTGTNQTKIYINGTNDGTGTVSTDFNQTSIMYVGADRVGGSALNGYIDDLRITKGIARYTTTFTPPTQAFPNQ